MNERARVDISAIEEYLRTCRELSVLCLQNGWIDNDTLKIELIETDAQSAVVSVQFDELIMKGGTGCVGTPMPRFGKVRVTIDQLGKVEGIEIL